MKIRNGFVSNSSSSSFIIGIAKIEDRDKFDAWVEKNKKEFKLELISVYKVKDLSGDYKGAIVESFMGSQVSIPLVNLKEDDEVVIFDYIGNEGDGAFMAPDDEWGEPDYDIDFNFFDVNYQKIYDGFSQENGLSMVDRTFGAGRNG